MDPGKIQVHCLSFSARLKSLSIVFVRFVCLYYAYMYSPHAFTALTYNNELILRRWGGTLSFSHNPKHY